MREPSDQDESQIEALFRTSILNEISEGAESDELIFAPLLYQKLRRMARGFMAKERKGHTLQPTDLVHDTFLRLLEQNHCSPKDQAHFLALAATMMRRILVNHATARKADKRGGGAAKLTLSAAEFVANPADEAKIDILELDQALTKLGEMDKRMATIVELRYFAGMSIEDTAAALEISPATVKREWGTAKLWLTRELKT